MDPFTDPSSFVPETDQDKKLKSYEAFGILCENGE